MLFLGLNTFQIIILTELTIVLVLLFILYRKTSKRPTFQSFYKLNKPPARSSLEKRKKKYANTGLSSKLAMDYKKKIVSTMEEEKLYLKSDLKLKDLADEIGLSKHQTSQLVNEIFNKDFNSFINEYRIEEAILLLQNDPNLTINDVLYDVGFNNSSTFYNAFKKFKHIRPSEYLNKQLSGNNVKNYNS